VNLFGTIDVTMTFLPLIRKSQGRVVNTASVSGRLSMSITGPYCVSKFGVEAFTDSLRSAMLNDVVNRISMRVVSKRPANAGYGGSSQSMTVSGVYTCDRRFTSPNLSGTRLN
jgi:NAD(P)-dependent dehydrogenase (short-subunit alcohol dehydrogenase family)